MPWVDKTFLDKAMNVQNGLTLSANQIVKNGKTSNEIPLPV